MLSANVICAIHVLLEMNKAQEKNTGKPLSPPLLSEQFGMNGDLNRPVLRRVLHTLVKAKYVTYDYRRKYTLLCEVSKVTLLDLIRLFHGGVCIGEPYDHYRTIGREFFPTEEYRKLLKVEECFAAEFTERLQSVTLGELREM